MFHVITKPTSSRTWKSFSPLDSHPRRSLCGAFNQLNGLHVLDVLRLFQFVFGEFKSRKWFLYGVKTDYKRETWASKKPELKFVGEKQQSCIIWSERFLKAKPFSLSRAWRPFKLKLIQVLLHRWFFFFFLEVAPTFKTKCNDHQKMYTWSNTHKTGVGTLQVHLRWWLYYGSYYTSALWILIWIIF